MHDPCLHLFVDDFHIRNAFALKRVFHSLERSHTAVLTDIPGRYIGWACAMHEGPKYRLWYHSVAAIDSAAMTKAGVWGAGEELGYFPDRYPGAIPETSLSVISYAESEDGLHWTKPDLGLIEWAGSKSNNIVLDGAGAAKQFDNNVTNMDSVSVVRDESETDPAKRYKMICHWETHHCWDDLTLPTKRPQKYQDQWWSHRAKYLTTSPDGIHWNAPLTRIKSTEGGDYCGITKDERNGHWWFNDRPNVGMPVGYIRAAGLCISADLYHWPDHTDQVLFPGEPEDFGKRFEHHGFTPFNYGDQDLGFLERSVVGATVENVAATHRDGERWKLAGENPILQVGPKGADDDSISVITRNAPFVAGDRLRFYYNGRRNTEKPQDRFGGIFMGDMRLDGFASMTVDDLATRRLKLPAVLQTQPLPVHETRLQLNIQGHHGSARVALLDDLAKPIAGYELENCLPIEEDAVRASVKWKERTDLSALNRDHVIVMIQLQTGSIYSVRC